MNSEIGGPAKAPDGRDAAGAPSDQAPPHRAAPLPAEDGVQTNAQHGAREPRVDGSAGLYPDSAGAGQWEPGAW